MIMYDNIFCEVWERRVSETKVVNKIHHHSDPENPKIIETVKTKVELDVLLFENIPSSPTTPGKDQDVIFVLPEKRDQYNDVNSDYVGESLRAVFDFAKYPTKIAKFKGGLYPITGIESLVEYLLVDNDDVLGHLEITDVPNEPKGRVRGIIHLIDKNIDQFVNRPINEIKFRLRIHPILTRIIALDYVDPNGL